MSFRGCGHSVTGLIPAPFPNSVEVSSLEKHELNPVIVLFGFFFFLKNLENLIFLHRSYQSWEGQEGGHGRLGHWYKVNEQKSTFPSPDLKGVHSRSFSPTTDGKQGKPGRGLRRWRSCSSPDLREKQEMGCTHGLKNPSQKELEGIEVDKLVK